MKLNKEAVMGLVNAYKETFGLSELYRWVAVDKDGEIKMFTKKPQIYPKLKFWISAIDDKREPIYMFCIICLNNQLKDEISNWRKLCFKL